MFENLRKKTANYIDAFNFARKTNLNKFDIGQEYNDHKAREDYLGFFLWLSSRVSIGIRDLVKKMIDNLKEGLLDARIAAKKGNKVKDKTGLPDSSVNEYQNRYPDSYRDLETSIFKSMGMSDVRYFDKDFIARAACVDDMIEKYIEEQGGKILNDRGKNITKQVEREAHRSIELGDGLFSLKFNIQGKEYNICMLEENQAKQVAEVTGEKDFLDKSSDKYGDFYVFDMENKDIRDIMANFGLQRRKEEAPTVEVEKTPEEKSEKPEENVQEKPVTETKEAEKKAEETKEKDYGEGRTLIKATKYPEIKSNERKIYMNPPSGKKEMEEFEKTSKAQGKDSSKEYWKGIIDYNKKFKKELSEKVKGKDLKNVLIKVSIDSKLLQNSGIFKVPLSTKYYPNGVKNPSKSGKDSGYIRINSDINLGEGVIRKQEHEYPIKDKDGNEKGKGKNYIFTLSLAENFPILNKNGDPISIDGKPVVVSALDLLSNFTLQEYCLEPKQVGKSRPEAYIADKAKGNEKAIVFDKSTTKIRKDTVADNPNLEELDFNHAKITVRTGAFKNLSSEIRIKNAENVTFDKGAFENVNRLVFVEPEIVSDNKSAILSDLASKAAAIGATYEAAENKEPAVDTVQDVEKVEEEIKKPELTEEERARCERAERELLERNAELEAQDKKEQEKTENGKEYAFMLANGSFIIASEVGKTLGYTISNPMSGAVQKGVANSLEELKQNFSSMGFELKEITPEQARASQQMIRQNEADYTR